MTMLVPAILLASNLIQVSVPACPPKQTEIRISQDVRPPRIDLSKTQDQLKTMKVADPVTNDLKFADTIGITDATISVDSEIRTTSAGPANGPVCVWPSIVSIKLSTAPTIYVDVSHGACRQAAAMEHEMRHVAIDRELIARFLPIFRARVTRMTEAIGSVAAPSNDDLSSVRERIEEKINAMLAVTYDSMAAERGLLQQAQDSPQEYRRISNACSAVSVDAPSVAPHVQPRHGNGSS